METSVYTSVVKWKETGEKLRVSVYKKIVILKGSLRPELAV